MTKHVSLRLADELHRQAVIAANRAHRSLNGQIEWCIERQLGLTDALYTEENRRTVLVGDTYETPEDAARYAADEAAALEVLGETTETGETK